MYWYRLFLSRLLCIILLFTAAFNSEEEDDSDCPLAWKNSFVVTNDQCPRFMYAQTGIEHGLGDQLERIFLAMSLIHGRSYTTDGQPRTYIHFLTVICSTTNINSCNHQGYPDMNITLVVDDTFGSSSLFHYPEGYGTIFHDILHFPRHILRYSQVSDCVVAHFYQPTLSNTHSFVIIYQHTQIYLIL